MPLSAEESALGAAVAAMRPRIEEDIERWVSIPTGWGYAPGLDELRGLLRERLEKLGGRAELLPGDRAPAFVTADPAAAPPPTLVVRGPTRAGRRILISCHLDTVFDPKGSFRALVRGSDGIAVGPGACDMKGGIALAVAALTALEEKGRAIQWTVVMNSDEETGSFHSARHLQALAREHDVGFATEPAMADGGLVTARMGSGQFKIECRGRAAHSGRDFAKGVSAVNALAEAIVGAVGITDLASGRIVNVGPLQGGEAANIVPESAAAWGSVRFGDRAAGEAIDTGLARLERGSDSQLPRVIVHRALNRPAKPLTPQVREVADICRAASVDLGQPLPFGSTGGTSDGNTLQDAGLPTIDSLGVEGGNLHRPDEFIRLDRIPFRAQLLAIVLWRSGNRDVVLSPSTGSPPRHG